MRAGHGFQLPVLEAPFWNQRNLRWCQVVNSVNNAMRPDVAIAGGGIIGLALGLEMRLRGMNVTVLERGQPMRAASWAAGGMLAVDDPQNPPGLMDLARLSARLYPEWLQRIEELSGRRVPMRTRKALQWVGPQLCGKLAASAEIGELAPGLQAESLRFQLLEENSVDPRDLCAALPKAFLIAGGSLLQGCETQSATRAGDEVHVQTTTGHLTAKHFVNCCGAWSGAGIDGLQNLPVEPVKGQMVELRCAPEQLKCVVRSPGLYLVPRGDGRVTVGATIERIGFDTKVEERVIAGLISSARRLMPELEIPHPLDSWAGLRPGTPDGLPVMGPALDPQTEGRAPRCWHATGHYRDGILLAPATARVMAQAIAGESTNVPLDAFSAKRFLPPRQ